MEPTSEFFEIEVQDQTLIVTPQYDMGELDQERINAGMKSVFDRLADAGLTNLVLDFHKTSYYGSTALGFFVRLWKTIITRKGRMAFCNLSEHEREILTITKLDNLWSICKTRSDALRTVTK